ncbi:hypothetical protein A8924_0051 [Saccharopolyspora erythraea NRRL 2338]|uniref:Uncharacterized protein n=2 Tax=Saccharopolyspora erythraea TaxID=1836 RepID=A4FQA7_SACEN|nr:DUF5302 domain-containing protein [Saccharopolyspora erythraea]EQD86321.1 hypothetical protein N599_10235 [Saccharopolyspora erythraea D]PFG92832.1 hypothetical protein A8924_0051 [Saccharopolyspora erythraea NRRL 2338]QRK89745.1 DUF5302 domain-containing protein [Saccharopolyspora erythraea]CAM06232.1 hypothetical protein SACE_7071 [Saccharopolyspora erythraea NRRL 2338]
MAEVPEQTSRPDDEQTSGPDDLKRRMREALERKNGRTKAGEAHQDRRSKADAAHNRAGQKRTFRRKSG